MSMAAGAASEVTRSNSIVVDDCRRPRTVDAPGSALLLRVWKTRNDFVVSTGAIVRVWIPFAVLTAVPDCTCSSTAADAGRAGRTTLATAHATSHRLMRTTARHWVLAATHTKSIES